MLPTVLRDWWGFFVGVSMADLRAVVVMTTAWLDSLDPNELPSPNSDSADLRAIGEALRTVAASDLSLAEQVARARANGRTWTQIGAVLGVSKQAARERFRGACGRLA